MVAARVSEKLAGAPPPSAGFATLTVTITVWVFHFVGLGPDANPILVYLLGEQHLVTVILISTIALLIIVKHRKNYVRLLNGTESNFKKAKKEKKEALAKAKLEEQNNLENKENLES